MKFGTMNNNVIMGQERITHSYDWNPAVEEESCNGVREVSLRTKHFTNGKIFLTGEVTDNMANHFISELLYLVEKGNPIDIYINSPGGSATSIKKTADSILETKTITNGILSKHTGKTIEEIDAATSFDNFMNAKEAIEFGLCDEIRNIF